MRFSLSTFIIFIVGASSLIVTLITGAAWREIYSNSSIGNGWVGIVGFSKDDAFVVIDDGNVHCLSIATLEHRVFDPSEVDALLAVADYRVLFIGHDGKLRRAKVNAMSLEKLEPEDSKAYSKSQAGYNSREGAIALIEQSSRQCILWTGNESSIGPEISLREGTNFRVKPTEDGRALIAVYGMEYQVVDGHGRDETGHILHKRGVPLADFLWLDIDRVFLCLYESGQVDCYTPTNSDAVYSGKIECIASIPGSARATGNGRRVAILQPNSSEVMLLDFRGPVSDERIPVNGLIVSGDLNAEGDRICIGLHGGEFCIVDAVSGRQVFREQVGDDDIYNCRISPSGGFAVCFSRDRGLVMFKRLYPEFWWGQFYRIEVWLTIVLSIALIWSLRRDWKTLRVKRVESKAAVEVKGSDA
ncbi:MAG: hypothetical protein L6R28_13425 [Planctomycetes bacterium]|nr:hypothetical protein [Planctomycetota bacterium]